MKKKNGFIATSIMYSFFAVFSMVALIILATYSHYRVLINNINNNVLNELNTQIASKYTTIYNLVNNGDFEEDTDWNYTNTTRITKDVPYGSSYSGTYSARMPKTDSSFNQTFSIKDKVNADNKYHKIYVAFRVFRNGPVTGTGTINLNASGNDYAINGSTLTGGFSNWTLYSEIIKVGVTNETDWTLNFNIAGNTKDNYTFIDNVMVVDVTDVYNGNTTPDSDMKNNLDTYLGYFSGSYVMTKYGNGVSTTEEDAPTPTPTPTPEPVCACNVNQVFNFDYTGGEQTFTAQCGGYYKLETWGASGAQYDSSNASGKGAYSVGIVQLSSQQKLYLYVGGVGTLSSGGYNGGGYQAGQYSGGGGATHIASNSGLLSSLNTTMNTYSSTTGTSDSSVLLIVAGGGGSSSPKGSGGSGGGYTGVAGYGYWGGPSTNAYGGSQLAGGYSSWDNTGYGSFGKGGVGNCGGGGGLYGGGAGDGYASGGGSGYIGSSSLTSTSETTKHMICYNCTSSTATQTTTNTTTNVSSTATSDYAKTGNGYARITYIIVAT